MYTDSTLKPIYGDYTAPDGTQYPANYPKDEIQSLHIVNETPAPSDQSLVVTGFTIDAGYNQVWTTRAKTSDELAAELKNSALAAMNKTEVSVSRIVEAVVAGRTTFTAVDVMAFMAYRTALRAIITSGTGELPIQPVYPAGT